LLVCLRVRNNKMFLREPCSSLLTLHKPSVIRGGRTTNMNPLLWRGSAEAPLLCLRSRPRVSSNVTSAEWQVTLFDPVRHVDSRSGDASCKLLDSVVWLVYLLTLQRRTRTQRHFTLNWTELEFWIGCKKGTCKLMEMFTSDELKLYTEWIDVTESMVTIRSPFCGYNLALCVELMGEDLPCNSNKI